jgi:hypothetical protein
MYRAFNDGCMDFSVGDRHTSSNAPLQRFVKINNGISNTLLLRGTSCQTINQERDSHS